MNKRDFAEFLKRKRKELNLTQEELAKNLYVSRNIVSRWENGVSYPDIETTQRLAEVLGVEPNEIFKQSSINDNKQTIKPTMIIAPIIGLLVLIGLVIIPLSTRKGDIITPVDKFDKLAPQYYMDDKTAASENRYYFVQDDGTLVYYDFESSEIRYLCKINNCEHKDENCDAYKILEGKIDSVWYYNDRLYMIESNNEGDRIVSYDLEGQDKRKHAVFNIERCPIASMCFNNGYLYYVSVNRSFDLIKGDVINRQVYCIAIDENSEPELLTSYSNGITQDVEITLTAMPQIVYINLKYVDIDARKNTYILDYYDIASNNVVRTFETDSELTPHMIGWNKVTIWGREKMQGCLFDEDGNMYYATAKDNQYIINKFNVFTKKQEKLYSINCNTYEQAVKSGEISDAKYIQLQLFDGKYFYVIKGVNLTKKKDDYIADSVKYGPNNSKMLTTKVDTNYIYVLDSSGNCVDIIEIVADGIVDRYDKQTGNLPISLFVGSAQRLIMKTEYTVKKYNKMYEFCIIDGNFSTKIIR